MITDYKRPSLPLRAQLEMTYNCNYRCQHCYALSSDTELRPASQVERETVLAVARTLAGSGIFNITITGGEPLTDKPLARELVGLFSEKDIHVSMNTNLSLLDEPTAQFLKENKVNVLTSCPSSNPEAFGHLTGFIHYALFEKGLRLLVSKGVHVTVNMVVTQENKGEIIQTAKRIKQLGCNHFGATPMSLSMDYPRPDLSLTLEDVHQLIRDLLWIDENLGMKVDILEALPKCCFPADVLAGDHAFLHRKCSAGEIGMSVSPDGEARPCGHNSNSYGNILKEGVAAVWENMRGWAEGEYIPEECRSCAMLSRCKGGCRINAMTARGDWKSMDIWAPGPLKESEVPVVVPKVVTLKPDTVMKVSRAFIWRDEKDGTILYFNRDKGNYFIVDGSLHAFMVDLAGRGAEAPFSSLEKAYCAADDPAFKEVVTFLLQKGFLKAA